MCFETPLALDEASSHIPHKNPQRRGVGEGGKSSVYRALYNWQFRRDTNVLYADQDIIFPTKHFKNLYLRSAF